MDNDLNKIRAQIKKIKAQTRLYKKQAESERKKIEEIKAETESLRQENQRLLRNLDWEGLTEEEFEWLRLNYNKEWHFFRPTVDAIKQRFAERTGKTYKYELDPKFKGVEEFATRNGWIDKSGTYHPVKDFAQHDAWAWDYLQSQQEEPLNININSSEIFEERGWVRVMAWPGVDPVFSFQAGKLNNSQKDAIYLYCSLYNVKLPL